MNDAEVSKEVYEWRKAIEAFNREGAKLLYRFIGKRCSTFHSKNCDVCKRWNALDALTELHRF